MKIVVQERHMRLIVFLHIALVFFLLSPVQVLGNADKLKFSAQKYYWGKGVKQDFSKALELYLQAAKQGDNEAKYIAGGMFYKGLGTRKNLHTAFKLLYGAALQGNSTLQSQKILGQFFLTGHGVPRNYSEAKKWYTLAAQNGDPEAQSELAFLYFTGKGGERDSKQAFHWYQKSAHQGLAVAQYSVGIMYFTGSGVEQPDTIKSYGWLSLAASQNHPDAVVAQDYLEKMLSPEELKQAQDYAVSLYQHIKK